MYVHYIGTLTKSVFSYVDLLYILFMEMKTISLIKYMIIGVESTRNWLSEDLIVKTISDNINCCSKLGEEPFTIDLNVSKMVKSHTKTKNWSGRRPT